MLRILLIILVALAVIIGLMRLTGRSGGDRPAAGNAAVEGTGALPAPVDAAPVEEAIEALEEGSTLDGEAATDVLDPALLPAPDPAPDAIGEAPAAVEETIEDATGLANPPAGENAVADPASGAIPDTIIDEPVINEPAAEPEAPTPPGR